MCVAQLSGAGAPTETAGATNTSPRPVSLPYIPKPDPAVLTPGAPRFPVEAK